MRQVKNSWFSSHLDKFLHLFLGKSVSLSEFKFDLFFYSLTVTILPLGEFATVAAFIVFVIFFAIAVSNIYGEKSVSLSEFKFDSFFYSLTVTILHFRKFATVAASYNFFSSLRTYSRNIFLKRFLSQIKFGSSVLLPCHFTVSREFQNLWNRTVQHILSGIYKF